jgi:hypothetical protein
VEVQQMPQAIQDFVFVLNIVVPTLSSFSHMKTFCITFFKFGTMPLDRVVVSEK